MYEAGRTPANLFNGSDHKDSIFANQKADQKTLSDINFQHCTFSNISFLKATLSNITFINCVFFNCYFRRANVQSCRFIGCRFIECKFPNIDIHLSDFRFSIFTSCAPEALELIPNLPSQASLRMDITKNLYIESDGIGQWDDARKYYAILVAAREQNYLDIILSNSSYYKTHYDYIDRIKSVFYYIASKISGQSWGHGENSKRILRNISFLIFLPLFLFVFGFDEYSHVSTASKYWDLFFYGAQTALPIKAIVPVTPAGLFEKAVSAFCSILGLIFLALLASYIFRSIRKR